jgi:hypothetical protein
MKQLINTSVAKYVVNVLMIVVFVGSAVTGLFFMEGGEGLGRGHRGNPEQFQDEQEMYEQLEMDGFVDLNLERNFEGGRQGGSESSEGIHQVSGIIWLILMVLHTIQHWNWYKKLFTRQQMMKNKLLVGTLLVFVIFTLTSLGLLTEIIPRDLFNLKELHGFFGQLMIGLMLIHIVQRVKWYVTHTQKLFIKKELSVSTI